MKNLIKTLLISWISLLFLSGCVTRNKVVKYMDKNPEMMAKYCATEFPVKTEYIRGKSDTVTTVVKDTVVKTLDCPPDASGNVTVLKCPPNEFIYKYIHNTDTLIRENFAMTERYRLESNGWETKYNKANIEKDIYQGKASTRLWIIIGMGVCLAVLLFSIIRK